MRAMEKARKSGDAGERLRVISIAREEGASFAEDVRSGLTASPKTLSPKYFYDELGSHLFEAICCLPEYYLTRAEDQIFSARAAEIAAAATAGGKRITLVELGSGSAAKTRRIIEALLTRQGNLLYIPVDISEAALDASARALLQSYPALKIAAHAGDYESAMPVLRESFEEEARALVLFLGSNIGNFDPEEARSLLRQLRTNLRTGDRLLIGADLKKDAATLEAAYDDPLGVTAAFNLNILARINRELEANFDLRAFRHRARFNESESRVEMHIESLREQRASIKALSLDVSFQAGETIHTESSYKYDLSSILRLAESAGYARTNAWTDERERFSSNLLVAI